MWIRQPLYAGDLWDVDKEDWEYEPVLVKDTETKNIMVKFQQVPPEHLHKEIFSQAAEMFGPDKTDKDGETKTKEKEKESDPQTMLLNIGLIRMNILMLDTRNVEQTKYVHMYIEEFILVEIWIHCCTKLN